MKDFSEYIHEMKDPYTGKEYDKAFRIVYDLGRHKDKELTILSNSEDEARAAFKKKKRNAKIKQVTQRDL